MSEGDREGIQTLIPMHESSQGSRSVTFCSGELPIQGYSYPEAHPREPGQSDSMLCSSANLGLHKLLQGPSLRLTFSFSLRKSLT